LSSQRPLNRTITRLTIGLTAPAFAVAALAAGGGLSASAAAQPASQVRLMSVVSSASTLTLQQSSSSAAASRRLSAADEAKKPKKKKKHHKKSHKHLTAKQIAWDIMSWFHWKAKWQFRYLDKLWMRESSWNVYAANPYSGAYGIPQALPGYKMASVAKDWRTDPKTQIRWGMRYIKHLYGSPKNAWAHEIDYGWY
jgi:hypothetical protein